MNWNQPSPTAPLASRLQVRTPNRGVRHWIRLALVSLVAASVLSCSVNPATGKRELTLVSEAQEIALGREAHPQIVAQYGLYPDEGLQQYLQDLGRSLAADSERPDLPWTFTLLDDPLVNAFALPGGFIYITRGIMTHLNSEAELVGILGHEIGHVTARHGVSQMSRSMLAQLGLGIGMIAAPELGQAYGGIAQSLAGLLFLKYGRDDERESDMLGVRYALRGSYDPREMIQVFDTLARVSEAAGGAQGPAWASTHPAPENRAELIEQRVAELGGLPANLRVAQEPYLRRLDGMIFGANPREGFFEDSTFYHPDLAFQLDFPRQWQTQNARQYVGAINQQQDAIVQLSLAQGSSPSDAASKFFGQQGIEQGRSWTRSIGGFPTVSHTFGVQDAQGTRTIEGYAAWLDKDGVLLQLLGYAKAERASAVGNELERSLSSFQRLRDTRLLNIEPMRVDIVQLRTGGRLQDLSELRSAIPDEQLALINRLSFDATIAPGSLVKTVHGFNPTLVRRDD